MLRAPLSLRLLPEWVVLTLLLAGGAALTAHEQWLWRLDLALYDAALAIARPRPPDDILIVAVDEASLAAFGRWPWPRRVHAALLDRLTRDQAAVVGLDLILAEPERSDPEADAILEGALRRNGRTVLPVLMEYDRQGLPVESRPLPRLAAAAAGLGHVHLELDRDGIARSAFLHEGLGSPRHPHFALALLRLTGTAPAETPGLRNPSRATTQAWSRDHRVHFAFAGPPGSVRQIPYLEALHGQFPDGHFRNRIVLVGATAAGLGDVYPTPVSGEGIPMPGVEISANLLHALRAGKTIVPVADAMQALLAPLPVLLLMLAYGGVSARRGLLLTATGTALLAATVLLLLHWERLWFPPAVAAVFMLSAYPLWSWRRLESAQRHLDGEFARLREEPGVFPAARVTAFVADPLERRMAAVRAATAQLRDMRRLLADSLDGLPVAALVANVEGRVVLANRRAAQYLAAPGPADLVGNPLKQLLGRLVPSEPPPDAEHWEAVTPSGRALLVSRAPLRTAGGAEAGAIVSLVDISELKSAQRKRDELLSYVSHDLRSPQASILALVNAQGGAPADRATLARIENFAHRTLALAGDLVELSRAEASKPWQFAEVNFSDVAHDAADEIWPQAQAKSIRVDRSLEVEALVRGDPHLLRRALTNLMSNAVKYSPAGTRIRAALERDGNAWCLAIEDEGYGIAPEDLPHVLQGQRRFQRPGQPPSEGSGLGLALVRTVAEKHGGLARLAYSSERGSRFELHIPVMETPADDSRAA